MVRPSPRKTNCSGVTVSGTVVVVAAAPCGSLPTIR